MCVFEKLLPDQWISFGPDALLAPDGKMACGFKERERVL